MNAAAKGLANDPFVSIDEALTGAPAKPRVVEAAPARARAAKPKKLRTKKPSTRETVKPKEKTYNKTGSRGDPYETKEGVLMVKTTFTATFELELVLSTFAGTLRTEPRNTWMERVLRDAIIAERGQAWYEQQCEVASEEMDRIRKLKESAG